MSYYSFAMAEGPYPILIALLVLFLSTPAIVLVYRLYFHPLAGFKGPLEAAITSQWLHRETLKGAPEEIFEELHKKYDTNVLRIAPNELHITDIAAYGKIYGRSPEYDKNPVFYGAFLVSKIMFTMSDAESHTKHRRLLNPFFSKSTINKLEPIIVGRLNDTLDKITRLGKDGTQINISDAFRCMTVDVITEFLFGKAIGITNSQPDSFRGDYLDAFDKTSEMPSRLFNRPILQALYRMIPQSLLNLNPTMKKHAEFMSFGTDCWGEHARNGSLSDNTVVFDSVKELPKEEQIAESNSILAAGSDTTAYTLSVGVSKILSEPAVRDKLIEVLEGSIADPGRMPSLVELEKIQYLQACVKECVRFAMPVPGRLPRVVPESATLVVDGKRIPPGTIVGMSAWTMHFEESLWGSDCRDFVPERWMQPDSKHLEGYLVSFSKGPRNCIGMNLAYAEITATLAYLFRQFDMNLRHADLRTQDLFVQRLRDSNLLVEFHKR